MKKLLALLLALSMLLSFAACSANNADEGDKKSGKETTESTKEEKDNADEEEETPSKPDASVSTEPTATESAATEPAPTAPAKTVDIDKLNKILLSDMFPVQITATRKVENGFKTGTVVSLEGDDAFVITLKNFSGGQVSQITLAVLATTKDGVPCDLGTLSGMYLSNGNYAPQVKFLQVNKVMEDGEEYDQSAIRCDFDKVENISLFVCSYVDADGNEIINEDVYDWLVATLPQ